MSKAGCNCVIYKNMKKDFQNKIIVKGARTHPKGEQAPYGAINFQLSIIKLWQTFRIILLRLLFAFSWKLGLNRRA